MGSTPQRGPRLRARLSLEQLEDRLVPTGAAPTALDQLFLEQLNAARANPAAYGQSIGLDLSSIAPSQPLAFDPNLIAAALGHSQDMSTANYFGHIASNGEDPGQRMSDQGFSWTSWGESIAAGYNTTASALSALIIDAGVPDLGHRDHLLAIDAIYKTQSAVGIGILMNGTGNYQDYYTIDTATPANARPYLTGVVFNDLTGTGQYAVGEGLGNVTITVQGAGSTTTWDTGGYSLQLSPGTYTVTASGGGLTSPFTQTVVIGAQNVQLNIVQASQSVQQANAAFVANLWQSMLKRSPSPNELTTFSNDLNNGTLTQAGLTAMVQSSQEYRTVCTKWVTQVYKDMLGRQISTSELNNWLSYLQTTGRLDGVANAVLTSTEFQIDQWTGWVQSAYRTYLGRSASAAEVRGWIGDFQAGWTQASFVSVVATSGEFQARAGAGNSAFVATLYQDMLGRAGSGSEIAGWTSVLNQGTGRSGVVLSFLSSTEYQWHQQALLVTNLYVTCLARAADTNELVALANALVGGTPPIALEMSVLGSGEYYLRAARN